VAHTCNPSYLGKRDQEDGGSKPVRANSSRDPISKNLHKNRTVGVAQGKGPEFKPQYCQRILNVKRHSCQVFFMSLWFPKQLLMMVNMKLYFKTYNVH
jgi:hypothetical protein